MNSSYSTSLPKLKWKTWYWWFAFLTNIGQTASLVGLMIFLARINSNSYGSNKVEIYFSIIEIYLVITILLLAIFIFSYFFFSLKDYSRNFAKLKKTKTKSLANGLALNAFAWIDYLVAGIVVRAKLQAALVGNTTSVDGYSLIFGSLSALGFLGIFLAFNILLTISGFIYWTHFRFVMAADLFLNNPEVVQTLLSQNNWLTPIDWKKVTIKVMVDNPVLITKKGINKWTNFTDFYEKNKNRCHFKKAG